MYRLALSCALICCTSIPPAGATEAEGKPLDLELELGLVLTSGNTETRSSRGRFKALYRRDEWIHTVLVDALRTENRESTLAERYVFTLKSDYNFNEHDYLFGRIRYEDDRFSGYDYQATEAVGYGRRIVHGPELSADLEIGAGARQNRVTFDGAVDETILFGSGKLAWKLGEAAVLTEEINAESGETNTRTEAVTALKLRINGHLAMKISHMIQHNSAVPLGVSNTDSVTGVTLVIDY